MRIKTRINIVRNSLMTSIFAWSVLFSLTRKHSWISGPLCESTLPSISSSELGEWAAAAEGSELGMLNLLIGAIIENENEGKRINSNRP